MARRLTDRSRGPGRTLRISVLPLSGKFGIVLSDRHLLASQGLRQDAEAYRAWLETRRR